MRNTNCEARNALHEKFALATIRYVTQVSKGMAAALLSDLFEFEQAREEESRLNKCIDRPRMHSYLIVKIRVLGGRVCNFAQKSGRGCDRMAVHKWTTKHVHSATSPLKSRSRQYPWMDYSRTPNVWRRQAEETIYIPGA
jgi:hypothetical protein